VKSQSTVGPRCRQLIVASGCMWQLDATNRSKVSGVLVTVCGGVPQSGRTACTTVTAFNLGTEVDFRLQHVGENFPTFRARRVTNFLHYVLQGCAV
jgi:hypothetical protein